MKLIFLPKGGAGISDGGSFPIMEVPMSAEGAEKTTLNDFQWWAPTDKWQEWLKKNPRSWKAESEVFDQEEVYNMIMEAFNSYDEDPESVMGFEEFSNLFEEEGKEGNEGGQVSVSKEEASKKLTKFTFAYNKLLAENKIELNLSLDKLTPSQFYALILDMVDDKGQDVPETRNAYKMKLLPTDAKAKFYLAQMTETALTGPIPDDQPIGNTLSQVAGFVGRAALGGALAVLGISFAAKGVASLATRIGLRSWFTRIIPNAFKSVSIPGASSLARGFKSAKYFVTSLGGIRPFLFGIKNANFNRGAIYALKNGLGLAKAWKAGAKAVKTSRDIANVGKATNPVGWAITAITVGQQMYNWFSSNQAPRYGEIEDDGIGAQKSFSPGSIPDGQNITVCWTQEAGSSGFLSFLASIVVANDTRTTMELVKLGNFNGKAVFYLVDVHSESYKKLLEENSMILIFFDQGAKFDHGFFDNDDLKLEVLSIKDSAGLSANTIFHGYCAWEDFQSAYEKADDKALEVPENAPDEYSFYFKYGKSNREINVTGKLVRDLSSIDTVKNTFNFESSNEGGEEKPTTESYSFDISKDVMSFFEFSDSGFPTSLMLLEEEEEKAVGEVSNVKLTETQKIAPYSVEKIEYADKALADQELPDLLTFIVPSKYLEAEDNQSIDVDPIQDVTVKSPKKGVIVIETQEAPEPVPVEVVGATGATGSQEPEVEGGVPVEVTKDEVKVKYRDNPEILNDLGIPDVTKIKDKDRDDKIKFLDFITPEEKEELGIGDWDFIKKVKISKDGKGNPLVIRFKAGGMAKDRKRKIKSSDENFDTALKVAERILAGFKEAEDKEED